MGNQWRELGHSKQNLHANTYRGKRERERAWAMDVGEWETLRMKHARYFMSQDIALMGYLYIYRHTLYPEVGDKVEGKMIKYYHEYLIPFILNTWVVALYIYYDGIIYYGINIYVIK